MFSPAMVHTLDKPFQRTMRNMGLKTIDDPYGGDVSMPNNRKIT